MTCRLPNLNKREARETKTLQIVHLETMKPFTEQNLTCIQATTEQKRTHAPAHKTWVRVESIKTHIRARCLSFQNKAYFHSVFKQRPLSVRRNSVLPIAPPPPIILSLSIYLTSSKTSTIPRKTQKSQALTPPIRASSSLLPPQPCSPLYRRSYRRQKQTIRTHLHTPRKITNPLSPIAFPNLFRTSKTLQTNRSTRLHRSHASPFGIQNQEFDKKKKKKTTILSEYAVRKLSFS